MMDEIEGDRKAAPIPDTRPPGEAGEFKHRQELKKSNETHGGS